MSQIAGAAQVRSLTPCAVIVDTQNVSGQSQKVFGTPCTPAGADVRAGLALYGFDAVEIYAGIATRSGGANPSRRLIDTLECNQRYKDRLEAVGVRVLQGYLAEHKGVIQEKQVDVLCALGVLDIAQRIKAGISDAQCIIVLSEDMDLMPAYELAARQGVTVYAAALDSVHSRPGQIEWILLSQDALNKICKPWGRLVGDVLRSNLALIATSTDPPIKTGWKVAVPKIKGGRVLLKNNVGARGLLESSRSYSRSEPVQLYSVGVEMDPRSGRFPYLQLSEQISQMTFQNIEVGDVLKWISPTTVLVAIQESKTKTRFTASPGTLMPGQQVAVLRSNINGQQGRNLIGAISSVSAPPPGWSVRASTAIAVVSAVATPSEAWMAASLEATGDEVLIHAAWLKHAKVGSRLMVALAGTHPDGRPQAMPLTCCLP